MKSLVILSLLAFPAYADETLSDIEALTFESLGHEERALRLELEKFEAKKARISAEFRARHKLSDGDAVDIERRKIIRKKAEGKK